MFNHTKSVLCEKEFLADEDLFIFSHIKFDLIIRAMEFLDFIISSRNASTNKFNCLVLIVDLYEVNEK